MSLLLKKVLLNSLKSAQYMKQSLRTITISINVSKQLDNKQIIETKYKENYNCIYKFNYINHLRLFSRMKIYQTGLSVLSSFASVILYNTKIVQDLTSLLYINGAMVFSLIMLFVISRQTVKLVGRIYLSDDKSKVLISHLDFFGKRRDMAIDLDDIESLSTIDELSEKFVKLRLKNSDGHMLISLPLGNVYDRDGFLKLFKIDLKMK